MELEGGIKLLFIYFLNFYEKKGFCPNEPRGEGRISGPTLICGSGSRNLQGNVKYKIIQNNVKYKIIQNNVKYKIFKKMWNIG